MIATTDSPLQRLLYRATGISQKRPQPPRQIEYDSATGMLKWLAPRDTTGITHYRVRVNTDTGNPHIEVPAGQLSAVIPVASTAWISAYNSISGLESIKASGITLSIVSGDASVTINGVPVTY